jgi:hypothetical protein
VDIMAADLNNCGACGRTCAAPSGGSAGCAAGQCAGSCSSGQLCGEGTLGGGVCVNVFGNDAEHCGSCTHVCAAPVGGNAGCSSGVCAGSCGAGQALCGAGVDGGGACADLQTDNAHCGACDVSCVAALGESCQAGVCVSGRGCAAGLRKGFVKTALNPRIAACGDTVGYAEAVANASTTCAAGWRMCNRDDLNAARGPAPTWAAGSALTAWIEYTDATTNPMYRRPVSLTCGGGQGEWSNLKGTSSCTNGGPYPEGWRLVIADWSWDGSHESSAGCVSHTAHLCGYPGGSVVPMRLLHTACCEVCSSSAPCPAGDTCGNGACAP